MNATPKIPTVFPLLFGGAIVGIFVLGCVGANTVFWFVYTDFKTAGISKGWQIPLIPGFQ